MTIYRGLDSVNGGTTVATAADINAGILAATEAAAAAAESAAAALVSEGLADADAIQTAADALATAADLVETNQDTIDTALDVLYAAEWANKAEDSLVSAAAGGDLVDDYSALHHAVKASADATQTALDRIAVAADLVQTNQDTIDTAADLVQTNLDTIATAADRVQTALDVIATNADVVTTNANVVLTNADAAQTALDVIATAADLVQTNQDTTDTAADLVLTNADVVSADNARIAAQAAQTAAELAYDQFDDRYLGSKVSDPTLDNDGAALIEGALYWNSVSNNLFAWDGAVWVSLPTPTSVNPIARNGVLNQDPVSQGTSTRTGMSSTIYTGNGTSQSITTGVDMATGDFGGLVWIKGRSTAYNHYIMDTVRGSDRTLLTNSTALEAIDSTALTSFDSGGVTVGTKLNTNENLATHVAWSFQTNQKHTGVTNRNKAYTCHYNTDLGFSIVGYEGDGVEGHEIPHHLGVEPELSIFKNRDNGATNWLVQSSLLNLGDYLQLNLTNALANSAARGTIFSDTAVRVGSDGQHNLASDNIVSYHFASKAGISKVGKYIGTGAAGNYVDCGFKVGWVMIKNLTTATTNWVLTDSIRNGGNAFLNANTTGVEVLGDYLDFVDGGFVIITTNTSNNTLNDEYLFLAFAETALDGTKQTTDYSYPTTADTLSIQQDTLISFANGFNSSGQADTQESVPAATTVTLGVGFEDKHLWLYKDKDGVYDTTENRPLEGITRNDADTWGEVSPLDASLRTTAKHFGAESSTGVAISSDDTVPAYQAFDKVGKPYTSSAWSQVTTTNSWVQYKQTEKRILKSWRLKEHDLITYTPRLFTIEGSNDGLNWTAIDSTYTASDYVGNGAELWGDLQDTSANTVAYLYHRINTTANNGHGTITAISELEFNTILPSDYYLVNDGVMYNSAGTPIERTYLAEIITNTDGEVSSYTNLPVAKQRFNEVTIHNDLEVRGEISNPSVATAWVNFNGAANPPVIRDSYNVKDIVDLGTGHYQLINNDPDFDFRKSTIVFGASSTLAVTTSIRAFQEDVDIPRTKNTFTFYNVFVNSTVNRTNTDSNSVDITIFGGKD